MSKIKNLYSKESRLGIVYWIVIVIFYSALLYFFHQQYIGLSYLFHIAILLFPFFLIFMKFDSYQNIGIKKGKSVIGLKYIVFIFALLFAGMVFNLFLINRNLPLSLDFSNFLFPLTIILAPISEEIFFRGYLQTKLSYALNNKSGLLIVSFLFALTHLSKSFFASQYLGPATQPISLISQISGVAMFFFLGLLYGIVYKETESVLYPTIVHAGINLVITLSG